MKLTTKLLLGATVVAGLSMSAFAACATDVDFGGTKKITGLADGTETGEAVHYGQIFTKTSVAIVTDDNSTMTDYGGVYTLTAEKKRDLVCVNGLFRNHTGSALDATYNKRVATLPEGFRPSVRRVAIAVGTESGNFIANCYVRNENGEIRCSWDNTIPTLGHFAIGGCFIQ